MTQLEAQQFIDDVLMQLFPSWKPTDFVLKLWYDRLKKCEYDGTKKGIVSWYEEQTRLPRGPTLGILHQFKKAVAIETKKFEPVRLFALAKAKTWKTFMTFFWPKPPIPEPYIIEKMAEQHRAGAERMYAGEFVVVRLWEDNGQST